MYQGFQGQWHVVASKQHFACGTLITALFSYPSGTDMPDERSSTGTVNHPSGHRKNSAIRRSESPLDTPIYGRADLPARRNLRRASTSHMSLRRRMRCAEHRSSARKRRGEKRSPHANRIHMIRPSRASMRDPKTVPAAQGGRQRNYAMAYAQWSSFSTSSS